MNPLISFTPKIITIDTFTPADDDIFVYAGDDRQRLIFGEPLEFTEEEKEKIAEFEQYISENQLELPQGYDFRECYRYYQGWGFDAKAAYDGILDNHKFIQDNIPVNMEGLDEYLQKGMVYVYKRDKHYRPILVINVKKLLDTTIDDDTLLRTTLAVVYYALEHGTRPGAVENWLVILDCKDVGITQIPTSKLKPMVSLLQQNFRGRLFRLFGINVPFLLRAIWQLVKNMCDKFTQKKMLMYGSGYEKDILEYVNGSWLEQRFGGSLEDKIDNFYPPDLS